MNLFQAALKVRRIRLNPSAQGDDFIGLYTRYPAWDTELAVLPATGNLTNTLHFGFKLNPGPPGNGLYLNQIVCIS